MSILSILKKKKLEKTELKEKIFIKDETTDLSSDYKLNPKEISKEEFEASKTSKITDKYLIAKLVNNIPELANLLLDDKCRNYKFNLPAVRGSLESAISKTDKNDVLNKSALDKLVINENSPVAKEIALYLSKNYKLFRSKKTLTATAVIASAEIASEYIINEIKNNLDAISYEVKEIRNFLTSEYKSKLEETALFLEKTLTFKEEIILNEDRRKERISQIENHISGCIQLLKQAIIIINSSTAEIRDNYSKYEKAIYEIEDWISNLKTLYGLIAELCRVDYLFYQGTASIESCEYDIKLLRSDLKEMILGLNNWHQIEQLKLGVDIEKGEHKNTGLKMAVKKFFAPKEKQNDIEYSKIDDDVMMMIDKHMNMSIEQYDLYVDEIFDNNINLAIFNGEIYFMNNANA